jgi:hypothetical protein
MKSEETTRRSFAAALGALFASTLGSSMASAQGRATRFQPARHPQDGWLDDIPGDASTVSGGGAARLYA